MLINLNLMIKNIFEELNIKITNTLQIKRPYL